MSQPPIPHRVFVFSGHMVDAPGRAEPRFPMRAEAAAGRAIAARLDAHGAGPQDLALTQGAAGGDLLFAEACQARGVPLDLLLPLPEAAFIQASVLPSTQGEHWRQRFAAVRERLLRPPRVLDEAGKVEGGTASGADASVNVFERCNLWLIEEAFRRAPQVQFICLWNGGGGDGPGGTAHLMAEVQRRGGQVDWIDTRGLDGAQPPRPAPGASHSS